MITLSPEIRRQSVIAGLLAFLLFVAGVYWQAPIGFDSRFVLFAQEMLRHGPTVFPTTYSEPYADYDGGNGSRVVAVDCPARAPYPRACHDSFVIGFDGSAVFKVCIVLQLCLRARVLETKLNGDCVRGTFECAGYLRPVRQPAHSCHPFV